MTSGKCAHRMAYHIYLTRSGFIAQRPWRMRGRRSKWKWFWRGDTAPTCEIKRWDGSGLVAFHTAKHPPSSTSHPPLLPLPPHPSVPGTRYVCEEGKDLPIHSSRSPTFLHPIPPHILAYSAFDKIGNIFKLNYFLFNFWIDVFGMTARSASVSRRRFDTRWGRFRKTNAGTKVD